MTPNPATSCLWCGSTFTPRATGGHAQRFCRPTCRRAFDAAGRRWVAEAIASGTLPLDVLRSGAAATRALVADAVSPPPIGPAEKPAEGPDGAAIELPEALVDRLLAWIDGK
jgi:hypothetical protein